MFPYSCKYRKAVNALKAAGVGPHGLLDTRRFYAALAALVGVHSPDGEHDPHLTCKQALRLFEQTGSLPPVGNALVACAAPAAAKTQKPAPAKTAQRPQKADKLLWHFGVEMRKDHPDRERVYVETCQNEYMARFGATRQVLPYKSAKAILGLMRSGSPVSPPAAADAKKLKSQPVGKAKDRPSKSKAHTPARRPAIPPSQADYFRSDAFLSSWEWSKLRYQVLLKNDGRCEACGAGKVDGVRLHVDHIKPRSRFPELAMEISNLQCLCPPCNKGKSNWDYTDWRAKNRARDAAGDVHVPWERFDAF